MNWLKENWTDLLLFLWASLWTAAGIFLAVKVVLDNQQVRTLGQFFELFIFLNLAVLIFYYGFKTQLRLIREWKDAQVPGK